VKPGPAAIRAQRGRVRASVAQLPGVGPEQRGAGLSTTASPCRWVSRGGTGHPPLDATSAARPTVFAWPHRLPPARRASLPSNRARAARPRWSGATAHSSARGAASRWAAAKASPANAGRSGARLNDTAPFVRNP
jgi:hypothetical protein